MRLCIATDVEGFRWKPILIRLYAGWALFWLGLAITLKDRDYG